MTTFAEEIEQIADGPIESVVIGAFGWDGYAEGDRHIDESKTGHTLTWEEARPLLNYNYDDGFGAPECHAITAWTQTHVIFVSNYDGSTRLCSVPRNPADHNPDMPGGG